MAQQEPNYWPIKSEHTVIPIGLGESLNSIQARDYYHAKSPQENSQID